MKFQDAAFTVECVMLPVTMIVYMTAVFLCPLVSSAHPLMYQPFGYVALKQVHEIIVLQDALRKVTDAFSNFTFAEACADVYTGVTAVYLLLLIFLPATAGYNKSSGEIKFIARITFRQK